MTDLSLLEEIAGGIIGIAAALFSGYHIVKRINRGARGDDRAYRIEGQLSKEYRLVIGELRQDLTQQREEAARLRASLEYLRDRSTEQLRIITLLRREADVAREDRSELAGRVEHQERVTRMLPELMTDIIAPGLPTKLRYNKDA